jgi:hypothetical protein
MSIRPVQEGVAHLAFDPTDSRFACLFAADGSRSGIISSKLQAYVYIELFREFGYLSLDEEVVLHEVVTVSALPLLDHGTDIMVQMNCSLLYQAFLAVKDDPSPELYPWEIGSPEIEEDGVHLVCRRPMKEGSPLIEVTT